MEKNTDQFMEAAIEQAFKSLRQDAIPVGAVLVQDQKIVAAGHDCQVQTKNPTAHAIIECINNGGNLASYANATIYCTLIPCYLCAGAMIQLKIKRIIVGQSRSMPGAKQLLEAHGIQVIDLDLPECYDLLEKFIKEKPEVWQKNILRNQ